MPKLRSKERVYGPFQHRSRWRIVGVRADGSRVCQSFATQAEAQEAKDQALIALGTRTISQTVTDYLDQLKARGRKDRTIVTARYRLVGFFGLATGQDFMLGDLTSRRAETIYKARVARVAPDTHHGELALAKSLCDWAVKSGWLRANPFAAIEPVGLKSLGRDKDQLRLDEARRFLAVCLSEDTPEALACGLALVTGGRASEITDRVCRDVDDRGGLLWVSNAKTPRGNRALVVSHPVLKGRLWALSGRDPQEPLWGEGKDRHWLFYHVKRLCGVARVPVVTPHGLRRSHATIARVSGVAAETVARELGQDPGAVVTNRSYFAPGTDAGRRSVDVTSKLDGGRSDGAGNKDGSDRSPFPEGDL